MHTLGVKRKRDTSTPTYLVILSAAKNLDARLTELPRVAEAAGWRMPLSMIVRRGVWWLCGVLVGQEFRCFTSLSMTGRIGYE